MNVVFRGRIVTSVGYRDPLIFYRTPRYARRARNIKPQITAEYAYE
jgi:hypothetical protein